MQSYSPTTGEKETPQPQPLDLEVEQPIELPVSALPLQEEKEAQINKVLPEFNSPQQTSSPEEPDLQTTNAKHNDSYRMGEGSDMQAPNAKDEEPLTCSEPHLETRQDDNEQEDDALAHSDATQTEQGEIIETQTVVLKFEETSLPDRQPKLQQKVSCTLVLSPTIEETLPANKFELKMDESDIEEQPMVQQTVTVHIVDEQNSSEDKDREKPPDSTGVQN